MMLALTIRQPWAWAIFNAHKDVENREWPWPRKRRLPHRILVHTSKTMTGLEYDSGAQCIFQVSSIEVPAKDELPLGGIVGAVTVTGCVTHSESMWFGGAFGWTLEHPVALPRVIPCLGERGLWTVSGDIEADIRAAAKERVA